MSLKTIGTVGPNDESPRTLGRAQRPATEQCDNCGTDGAKFAWTNWDRCPTDRGTETREFNVYLCDECYEQLSKGIE